MFIKGYISFGQYGGVKTTANGKEVTEFSLSTKENGERKYYNHITAWHDGAIEREIVDGRYVGLDISERKWERDGKSGVNYTANSVWLRADGYDGLEKPEPYASGDLPF